MGNTQSQTVPDHESVFHPKPREMSITDRFNEFVAFLARNKQGTCFYLFDPFEAPADKNSRVLSRLGT